MTRCRSVRVRISVSANKSNLSHDMQEHYTAVITLYKDSLYVILYAIMTYK